MFKRSLLRFAPAVLAALLLAVPTFAGGWAVVTIDDLPTHIVAGQSIAIGFTVRQHGHTLRNDIDPILHFERKDTEASFTALAQHDGDGHYLARLSFPDAGKWDWHVGTEEFNMFSQPLPVLTVSAPVQAVKARAQASVLPSYIAELIRVLMGAASKQQAAAQAQPIDPKLLGHDLFLAKGCVMCHERADVRRELGNFSGVNIGPDLTTVQRDADYLRRWLKDPAAVKPGTEMPTLGLKPDEIEALIAFLSPQPVSAATCPVTPPLDERPPDKHLADWSPQGRWFKSPDGKIWVAANNLDDLATLGMGQATKVLWGKPAGIDLTVTGRRLDAEASPLIAQVSPYYHDDILNPSGIGVPTPGCWGIEARAGQSLLRIVIDVPDR